MKTQKKKKILKIKWCVFNWNEIFHFGKISFCFMSLPIKSGWCGLLKLLIIPKNIIEVRNNQPIFYIYYFYNNCCDFVIWSLYRLCQLERLGNFRIDNAKFLAEKRLLFIHSFLFWRFFFYYYSVFHLFPVSMLSNDKHLKQSQWFPRFSFLLFFFL